MLADTVKSDILQAILSVSLFIYQQLKHATQAFKNQNMYLQIHFDLLA